MMYICNLNNIVKQLYFNKNKIFKKGFSIINKQNII